MSAIFPLRARGLRWEVAAVLPSLRPEVPDHYPPGAPATGVTIRLGRIPETPSTWSLTISVPRSRLSCAAADTVALLLRGAALFCAFLALSVGVLHTNLPARHSAPMVVAALILAGALLLAAVLVIRLAEVDADV